MCGQTCAAIAAGVDLNEATVAVGVTTLRGPGTDTSELTRGLRRLGIKVGDPYPFKNRFPKFAIVAIDDNKTQWGHWVVIHEGFVYDPGIGYPLPLYVYEDIVIYRAYSRRYLKSKDAHKRVRAKWTTVIPIYGKKR